MIMSRKIYTLHVDMGHFEKKQHIQEPFTGFYSVTVARTMTYVSHITVFSATTL